MATEKRLIDANALKAHVNSVSTHWLNDWSTLGVLAAVDKIPTVDAVEVVRCKDCKHYNTTMNECESLNFWYSEDGCLPVEDDDFCSYGERKDDA